MRIFVGVPLGGGVKWQWGCRRRQFLAIWVATPSETSEIRPAILCYALSSCNWLHNEWPRMTLSGYFMSKSVFGQQRCRALTFALARLSRIVMVYFTLFRQPWRVVYGSDDPHKLQLDCRQRWYQSVFYRKSDAIHSVWSAFQDYVLWVCISVILLPRDASAERGDEIACRLSVCPSVRL